MAIPKVGDVITLHNAPWTGNWAPAPKIRWYVESVVPAGGYIRLKLRNSETGEIANRDPGDAADNHWPLMEAEIVINPFLSAVHKRKHHV